MRSMETALRNETRLKVVEPLQPTPRGPCHTLVMEAVKPPASGRTSVVEVDPADLRKSIPESEREPVTIAIARTTLVDRAPESERPESTILLVTIEELEAEAQGPATERIPHVPDRVSGIQLVQPPPQVPSTPPPMMMAMLPMQAFAPLPPKKSSAAIVITLFVIFGLVAIVGAGAYLIRTGRLHVPTPTAAASPITTEAEPSPAPSPSPAAAGTEAAPPVAPAAPEAKPEDSSGRVAVAAKKTARKKSAKRGGVPAASSETETDDVEPSNADPSTLLNKALDPATEL